MKIAIFPGSFDPITKGHEDIIRRAIPLFDRLYIAIGINSNKKTLFSIDERILWIKRCFSEYSNIEVCQYEGLTIDLCKQLDAQYLIRGIRNSADFRYERDIAQTNKILNANIETLFLTTSPQYAHISSSMIRELYLNKGDYQQFMPDNIF